MKVGVILCAWQAGDYLARSLTPWIDARKARLGGNDFVICAVSVPFVDFEQPAQLDDTHDRLALHWRCADIDHMVTSDTPMKETEARGAALRWLVEQGCDILVQWDSDEVATVEQLAAILRFAEGQPFTSWFRLSLVNLVFDEHTRLVDPFTPPRIHRVRAGSYRACGFYDDNNVLYCGTITRDFKHDVQLPSMTIPESVAAPLHYTWLNDERSKKKLEYQRRRWGHSAFRWDDKLGLQFNEAYYRAHGLSIPEVAPLHA